MNCNTLTEPSPWQEEEEPPCPLSCCVMKFRKKKPSFHFLLVLWNVIVQSSTSWVQFQFPPVLESVTQLALLNQLWVITVVNLAFNLLVQSCSSTCKMSSKFLGNNPAGSFIHLQIIYMSSNLLQCFARSDFHLFLADTCTPLVGYSCTVCWVWASTELERWREQGCPPAMPSAQLAMYCHLFLSMEPLVPAALHIYYYTPVSSVM